MKKETLFNDYVTQKKLISMLGTNTYGFKRDYKPNLPEPLILTNNRIPLYKLQDIRDFHEGLNFIGHDLTAYNTLLRHYRSDMHDYVQIFKEYVTVNEALTIVPFSKQSLSQASDIGFVSKIPVWGISFYYKESLKRWTMDNERLDRIRENFKQGTSLAHKKYKTYEKWLNSIKKW